MIAVGVCTLGTVATVSAHANLKTADPADKAVLPAAPAQVTLTFTEETSATMSTGAVTDASGAMGSTGFIVDLNERTKMTIALKSALSSGVYTVKFHTLTEDDNGMVDGTTTFTVQGTAGRLRRRNQRHRGWQRQLPQLTPPRPLCRQPPQARQHLPRLPPPLRVQYRRQQVPQR